MEHMFTAAARQEESWHVARCLESEVTSQGPSAEEAVNNLAEVVELHLEEADETPEAAPLITLFQDSAWSKESMDPHRDRY